MTKDLVIIGAGGFGREVADIARAVMKETNELRLIGFLDDDANLHGKELNEVPVLGNLEWIKTSGTAGNVYFVCAVGDPRIKKTVVERALALGYLPYTLIHPSVRMGYDVKVGEGTILCPGSIITTNINIGRHVILNQICSVGHDAVLEDYVTINPLCAVSGAVHLKEGVFIGTCATVLQGLEVGEWSVIGANASVIKSQEPYVVAVGVPTTVKKKLNS